MSNYIGSTEEAMQVVKAIGLRDARIRELEERVREDRKALLMLRIAVARTAQGMGYETPHLSVLDKSYEELHQMADAEEHGWKSLLWGAVDELSGG
jgi:hypothetical protein